MDHTARPQNSSKRGQRGQRGVPHVPQSPSNPSGWPHGCAGLARGNSIRLCRACAQERLANTSLFPSRSTPSAVKMMVEAVWVPLFLPRILPLEKALPVHKTRDGVFAIPGPTSIFNATCCRHQIAGVRPIAIAFALHAGFSPACPQKAAQLFAHDFFHHDPCRRADIYTVTRIVMEVLLRWHL